MNTYNVSYIIENYNQYVAGTEPHNDIRTELDQWVEADSQDEAIENAIDYLRDHCDGDTDTITDHYEDGFQTVNETEEDNQYFYDFTAKIIKIGDVNVLMADGCSQREAEKHLKNGTIVYDVTEEGWPEEYQQQENATLDEIKTGNAGSLTYLEYEDHEFVISYVL